MKWAWNLWFWIRFKTSERFREYYYCELNEALDATLCQLCGKPYGPPCPECKGTGKGGIIQGAYGECPVCGGDRDLHECSPARMGEEWQWQEYR